MSDGPRSPSPATPSSASSSGGRPPAGSSTPPPSPAEAAAAAAAAAVEAAAAAQVAAEAAAAATPGSTHIPAQRSSIGDTAAEPATGGRHRVRVILKTLAVILVAVCVVGGVLGYVAYDRATRVDRSSPTAVVAQYAYAKLEPRFSGRASAELECPNLREDGLGSLALDLKQREERYSVDIIVSVSNLQVT